MRVKLLTIQCALVSALLMLTATPAVAGPSPQAGDPTGTDLASGDTPRSGALRRFIAAAIENDLSGAWQYTMTSRIKFIDPDWTRVYPVDKAVEAGLQRAGVGTPNPLTLLSGCRDVPYALERREDIGNLTRVAVKFASACAVAPAEDDGSGGDSIGTALMEDFGALDAIGVTPVRVLLRKTATVWFDLSADPNESTPVLNAYGGEWVIT
jgi:hypothetical protein